MLYNVIYMSWWYTHSPIILTSATLTSTSSLRDVCVWKTSPRSMCVCLKWEQEPLGGLRTVNTVPVGLCSTVVCNPRRAYFTHLICNHVKQGLVGVRLNDPSRYATTSANPTAEKRNVVNSRALGRVLHFHLISNGSELLSNTPVSTCLILIRSQKLSMG